MPILKDRTPTSYRTLARRKRMLLTAVIPALFISSLSTLVFMVLAVNYANTHNDQMETLNEASARLIRRYPLLVDYIYAATKDSLQGARFPVLGSFPSDVGFPCQSCPTCPETRHEMRRKPLNSRRR